MRVRGDLQPSSAFTLEEQPKHPGFVLVRFFENAEPFEEKMGDLTISGYVYDEYHLELKDYDGLEADIVSGYDGFLAQAKLMEAEEVTIPQLREENAELREKVATLEDSVTETQMALVDIYENTMGG